MSPEYSMISLKEKTVTLLNRSLDDPLVPLPPPDRAGVPLPRHKTGVPLNPPPGQTRSTPPPDSIPLAVIQENFLVTSDLAVSFF